MIKIEKTDVCGWEAAIRGMRNPMNSWDKSDSFTEWITDEERELDVDGEHIYKMFFDDRYVIGPNDHNLMMRLANGGPVHAKYRRMIAVYVDITAPLYWWKEFDTYKVGTVANSCSTMHKIHAKEFTYDDFSHEHLLTKNMTAHGYSPRDILTQIINALNYNRILFLETKDKVYWHQMIQLLPTSYNQKRTIMFNYEVLAAMYRDRKNHKLDEWHAFCDWIESLPYSEVICGEQN